MSKPTITRLFLGAIVALVIGLFVSVVTIVLAIAGSVVTIGGSSVVTVNGPAFAGIVIWLLVAALAFTVATVLAIASWVGALLNTVQLEDKTWFVVILVLGLVSLGWLALLAYIVAGPDAVTPGVARRGLAAPSGT